MPLQKGVHDGWSENAELDDTAEVRATDTCFLSQVGRLHEYRELLGDVRDSKFNRIMDLPLVLQEVDHSIQHQPLDITRRDPAFSVRAL